MQTQFLFQYPVHIYIKDTNFSTQLTTIAVFISLNENGYDQEFPYVNPQHIPKLHLRHQLHLILPASNAFPISSKLGGPTINWLNLVTVCQHKVNLSKFVPSSGQSKLRASMGLAVTPRNHKHGARCESQKASRWVGKPTIMISRLKLMQWGEQPSKLPKNKAQKREKNINL